MNDYTLVPVEGTNYEPYVECLEENLDKALKLVKVLEDLSSVQHDLDWAKIDKDAALSKFQALLNKIGVHDTHCVGDAFSDVENVRAYLRSERLKRGEAYNFGDFNREELDTITKEGIRERHPNHKSDLYLVKL